MPIGAGIPPEIEPLPQDVAERRVQRRLGAHDHVLAVVADRQRIGRVAQVAVVTVTSIVTLIVGAVI